MIVFIAAFFVALVQAQTACPAIGLVCADALPPCAVGQVVSRVDKNLCPACPYCYTCPLRGVQCAQVEPVCAANEEISRVDDFNCPVCAYCTLCVLLSLLWLLRISQFFYCASVLVCRQTETKNLRAAVILHLVVATLCGRRRDQHDRRRR